MVLFLLLIMSLLILESFEQSILANKISYYAEQEAKTMAITQKKMLEIVKQIAVNNHDINCIYPTVLANDYPLKQAMWWQNNAKCSFISSRARIYYVLEKVQTDFCAEIISQKQLTDIYRLTIKGETFSTSLSVLLQSYIAVRVPQVKPCEEAKTRLRLGIQSWRRIRNA